MYRRNISPIEEKYHFRTDSDIYNGSMVLVLGQYSTGKTSFIRKILKGEVYDGARIGPEPTTDGFNAVVYDEGAYGQGRRHKEGQIASKVQQNPPPHQLTSPK